MPAGRVLTALVAVTMLMSACSGTSTRSRAEAPADAGPSAERSGPADDLAAGLWRGTVGDVDVVLQLAPDPEAPTRRGRYFYTSKGRDLTLWARPGSTGAGLDLVECSPEQMVSSGEACEDPGGRLSLRSSAGALVGTWSPTTGTAASPTPVRLAPVPVDEAGDEALNLAYERQRTASARFTREPGGRLAAVTWRLRTELRSKVSVPDFTAGASSRVLTRINGELAGQWAQQIERALQARDFADEVRVTYADRRWLTLTHRTHVDMPMTAHPTDEFWAVTYDLTSGAHVDWDTTLRFAPAKGRRLDPASGATLLEAALAVMTGRSEGSPLPSDTDADLDCRGRVVPIFDCTDAGCPSPPDEARTSHGWVLWPTPTGLALAWDGYSEYERACRGEALAVLPWRDLSHAARRPESLPTS